VSPTPSMLRYISTSLRAQTRPGSCIRQSHFNFFLNHKHRGFANIMAHLNGDAPKITLYTNHGCPWAHRAHIVLKELGLKYDEVIIDLNTPREPWYLEINPVSTWYSLCFAPTNMNTSVALSLPSISMVKLLLSLALSQPSLPTRTPAMCGPLPATPKMP
jgi:hypothetical protein